MSTTAKAPAARVDQFFTVAEARFDRWRSLLQAARVWEAAANRQPSEKEKQQEATSASFQELRQWEDFFAYPGEALLRTLGERITSGDATGTAHLAQSISTALLTHSYRTNLADWEGEKQSAISLADRVPGAGGETQYRPYFEVLMVSPARAATWSDLAQELRKLRRPQDKFIYEPVFVGDFEDAVLGAILNGSIEAVIIYEGISFASSHYSPVLREFLTAHLAASNIDKDTGEYSLALAQGLKQLRPELDIYFLSDRQPEKLAGDTGGACIRRVFYQVEEPLELHLSILDGIADRYDTPYFDNQVVSTACWSPRETSNLLRIRQHAHLERTACFSSRMALRHPTRWSNRHCWPLAISCWSTAIVTSPTTTELYSPVRFPST